MSKRDKTPKGPVARPFEAAARLPSDQITDLVRHLARISAENDHKSLRDSSKTSYTPREKKGPKNE